MEKERVYENLKKLQSGINRQRSKSVKAAKRIINDKSFIPKS